MSARGDEPSVVEALAGMIALCPRLLSRNRAFSFYAEPARRRAHRRGHAIRRLSASLSEALPEVHNTVKSAQKGSCLFVSYADASLSYSRTVCLSPVESSALRILLARSRVGVGGLDASAEDRRLLRACLRVVRGHLAQVL